MHLLIEFNDTVSFGVGNLVGENDTAVRISTLLQACAKCFPVENIVAKDKGYFVAADELLADNKRLGQTFRLGLCGVLQVDAELTTIAQKSLKLRLVIGRCDDQDVADTGEHKRTERVINHRFVIDRHYLF